MAEIGTLDVGHSYAPASLFRRFVAALVDSLILAGVGFVAGIFFAEHFSLLGRWGFLLGLSLAACYFSVLNSNLGGGQTFGKRLMKIQVVQMQSGPWLALT